MSAIAMEIIRSDMKAVLSALAEVDASLENIGFEYCRLNMRKDELLKEQKRLSELAHKIENHTKESE